MKKQLLDIVKAISAVPFDIVKVTAEDGEIKLQSRLQNDDVGMVILKATMKDNVPEVNGVFGLSNIGMLHGLCSVESFRDSDSKVSIKYIERQNITIPEEIVFEKSGFAKASYRLTNEKAIPKQFKEIADIEWSVIIDDVKNSKVTEFAQLAGIYSSQEKKFSVKTDGGQLKFLIGDPDASTHKAQYVFEENVTGKLKSNFSWNISGFLSILRYGMKHSTKIYFNNDGIIQVEIDTGVGLYTYVFGGSNG